MKLKGIITVVLGCLMTSLVAQKDMGVKFDSTAYQYAQTIKAEDLSEYLHVLASDEYEGRETGKKGQKMAAKYCLLYTSDAADD